MDNEYLQEKVMGEKFHNIDSSGPVGTFGFYCHTCKASVMENPERWHEIHHNRDFSTPTDYCALEDKMTELGEWGKFFIWLRKHRNVRGFTASWPAIWWVKKTRTQRAALIAEYWRQK